MTHDPILTYVGLPWSWDIHEDAEAGCWVATIAELPDFFAAGATSAEAALNSRDALKSHIAGYLESGTPIPAPATRMVSDRSGVLVDAGKQELVAA